MQGLTAKVFRTYNASYTMSEELKKMKDDHHKSEADKIQLYNECNRKVAILCNHKRTVGENHAVSMKKLEDKIKGLKYQKWRLKQMVLQLDSKEKKKRTKNDPGYFELDPDLTKEWIAQHQEAVVEEQRNTITKKFQKENEKLVAEGNKPLPEKDLKERLKAADEVAAKYKKENKTGKVEPEGKSPDIDKIDKAIDKVDNQVKNKNSEMEMKDSNKDVALGTSKIVSMTTASWEATSNMFPELHRPSVDGCLCQEV